MLARRRRGLAWMIGGLWPAAMRVRPRARQPAHARGNMCAISRRRDRRWRPAIPVRGGTGRPP